MKEGEISGSARVFDGNKRHDAHTLIITKVSVVPPFVMNADFKKLK